MTKTVVVGLSGGVDSSVSALLLKQRGFNVIGLFMRNWEEDEACPATADYEDALCVAAALDIPIYTVNFTQQYWDFVFSRCLKQYAAGYTPNPDILCNQEIKFDLFFKRALELGADCLATGHYCRIVNKEGRYYLARGLDPNKDQTYFLYTLKEEQLPKLMFPVGDLYKPEVRSLALSANLVTARKKDSTGICFVGKRDFKQFLGQYIPKKPGEFQTLGGDVVGTHDGMAYYTIGQRRGLGIGGAGDPWYVVAKDEKKNIVYVEQGDDHPALYYSKLTAIETSWVNGAPQFPFKCQAKIRYRSQEAPCTVIRQTLDQIEVVFDTPQKAVTAKQAIVFYQGDICLGGATIHEPVHK